MRIGKIPKKHKLHKKNIYGFPCGCFTGKRDVVIACPMCGACYIAREAVEFPIWRCYDCGAGFDPSKVPTFEARAEVAQR